MPASCLLVLTAALSVVQPAASPQPGDDATRHNAAGLTKARSRAFDEAIAEYSEAIRLDPTFAEAYRNRGLAEINNNDLDGAVRDFSRAISLNPRYASAFYDRGSVYRRQKNFDGAIEDFSQAVAINPTFANAYEYRGLSRADKGDDEGAIADLTTALSLDAKSARKYSTRGYVKTKKKDFDGAIADLDQAIALDPAYSYAYANRGEARAGKKDLPGAIADFTKAISLDATHAPWYYSRGLARLTARDNDGAIADFTQTLGLNPNHSGALTRRCQAHRARAEWDAAIEDCNQAVALAPKSALALTLRGQVRSSRGDNEGATRDLSEAINLEPKSALALYERCRIEVGQSALDRAIDDCSRAIDADSTLAVAYFERASAFDKRGNADEATRDYARAQSLDAKLVKPTTFAAGIGTGSSATAAGTAVNGVYRPGGDVSAPRVTREVRPQYTSEAMEARIQGTVMLECVVGADGRVQSVSVLRSLDAVHGLDTEAMKAARQWSFEPATRNGKPVASSVTVSMSFSLGASGAPAPLSLPDAFSAAPSDDSRSDETWQEQTFEQSGFHTHVRYPKGWATITGVSEGLVVLQNPAEPFGLALLPPQPAMITINQVASKADLQLLADGASKGTGLPIAASGQTRVGGRLWFWLDFGQILPGSVKAPTPGFAYAGSLVNATRAWIFTTTAAGKQFTVLFYVARMSNASAEDMTRVSGIAGPVFARILEGLSYKAP